MIGGMTRAVEREIDTLYALPPEEFTAARDRLAKDLKGSGDDDEAARVKSLRRPTVAAWAINQLVRREEAGVDALLATGDELRKAQRRVLSGASGSASLRGATDRRRQAVRSLVKAAEGILDEAGRSSAAALEAVQATLESASTDERAGRLFREGRLVKELPPPAGFGSVEGLALVPPSEPEPEPRPRESPVGSRAGTTRGGGSASVTARTAELRAERDEARRTARSLEREAERARKEATRASRAAVTAEEEADRVRRSAEEARERARELAAAARQAGSESGRAEREAERARRALEQAEERLAAGRR
jgi:DNA repair exonuclease SbcCD ATPase subunit